MTDNSQALKRARRQDSKVKRRQASQALQAMIDAGEPISFPAVARRAGVSVSLLYADAELAGRLTEARSRQRQAGRERVWRLPPRSLAPRRHHTPGISNSNQINQQTNRKHHNRRNTITKATLMASTNEATRLWAFRTPKRRITFV